jgi:cysteine-rich repeat protein
MPSRWTTAALALAGSLATGALAPACFLNSTAYESASGVGAGGGSSSGAMGGAAGAGATSGSGASGGSVTSTGGMAGAGGSSSSGGTGGSTLPGDQCPGIAVELPDYTKITTAGDTTKAEADYGANLCGGGPGRDLVYQVHALQKGLLTASLDKKESFDNSFLYLRTACDDQQSQRGCSDTEVSIPVEKDDVIWVVVDGHGDKAAGKFKLQLFLDGCQNGILEPGDEECDDGNAIENDQCTHDCKVRCTADGTGLQQGDYDVLVHPMTHHCYLQVYPNVDWATAKAGCESWGGYLAALTPQKEIDDLKDLLKKNGDDCWIGGNDLVKDQTYVWNDNELWVYQPGDPPWRGGEPNGGTSENCISIHGDATINDEHCEYQSLNHLCERDPIGAPPGGN